MLINSFIYNSLLIFIITTVLPGGPTELVAAVHPKTHSHSIARNEGLLFRTFTIIRRSHSPGNKLALQSQWTRKISSNLGQEAG